MLASLVVVFVLCWTPRAIFMLYRALYPGASSQKYMRMVGVAIQSVTLVNSMINPIVYAITSP